MSDKAPATDTSTAITTSTGPSAAFRDRIGHGNALAIIPTTFLEVQAMAQELGASSLISNALKNNRADIALMIMGGAELGFPPVRSISGLMHAIPQPDGSIRMAPSAAALAALATSDARVEYFEPKEMSDARCTWIAKKLGRPEISITWTIERALKMGAQLKSFKGYDTNWTKIPQQMLNARCQAELARIVIPDRCAGIMAAEELRDPIDVESREVGNAGSSFGPPPAAEPGPGPTPAPARRAAGAKNKPIDAQGTESPGTSSPSTLATSSPSTSTPAATTPDGRSEPPTSPSKSTAAPSASSPLPEDPARDAALAQAAANAGVIAAGAGGAAGMALAGAITNAAASISAMASNIETAPPAPADDSFGDDAPDSTPDFSIKAFYTALQSVSGTREEKIGKLNEIKKAYTPYSKVGQPLYAEAGNMRAAFAKAMAEA